MERIQGLTLLLQSNDFTQAQKDVARAGLEDIAANGSTAHERETAASVLKRLNATESADEIPMSDEMLRLLFLGRDTSDTAENTKLARERYYGMIRDMQ